MNEEKQYAATRSTAGDTPTVIRTEYADTKTGHGETVPQKENKK
jgi:hypothetical protein